MATAFSVEISGGYDPVALTKAAHSIREGLKQPARLAFAFLSADYVPHIEEFVEILRVDGHIGDVVSAVSNRRIAANSELPEGPGCVVVALVCDADEPVAVSSGADQAVPVGSGVHAALLLASAVSFDTDEWLSEWNARHPGVPCVGGLASGGDEDSHAVFLNDRPADGVCVTLSGRTTILPLVSQGCRPIGEPLTVTRAENNIVYALGGQPAYQALETAFESLSDSEKSLAKGNLFAGIAGTEYVYDFKPGDFLIRNIIGADPGSGAVVIGGVPRTGQTLQYQLRDREIAKKDLVRVLASTRLSLARPVATLLFSCLARGEKFFGVKSHDASAFSAATGGVPLGGFFCHAEIGPVATRSVVHSYTAAAAIWVEIAA